MTLVRWNSQEWWPSGIGVKTFGEDEGDEHHNDWADEEAPDTHAHREILSEPWDSMNYTVHTGNDKAILSEDFSARLYLDGSPVADNGALMGRFSTREDSRYRGPPPSPKELRHWRSGKGVTVTRRRCCSVCSLIKRKFRNKVKKPTSSELLYYKRCRVCTVSSYSPRKPLLFRYEAWLTHLGDILLRGAEMHEYQKAFEECLFELGTVPPTWPEWQAEMNPEMRLGADAPPPVYAEYEYEQVMTPFGPAVVLDFRGEPIMHVRNSDWEPAEPEPEEPPRGHDLQHDRTFQHKQFLVHSR